MTRKTSRTQSVSRYPKGHGAHQDIHTYTWHTFLPGPLGGGRRGVIQAAVWNYDMPLSEYPFFSWESEMIHFPNAITVVCLKTVCIFVLSKDGLSLVELYCKALEDIKYFSSFRGASLIFHNAVISKQLLRKQGNFLMASVVLFLLQPSINGPLKSMMCNIPETPFNWYGFSVTSMVWWRQKLAPWQMIICDPAMIRCFFIPVATGKPKPPTTSCMPIIFPKDRHRRVTAVLMKKKKVDTCMTDHSKLKFTSLFN